MTHYHSEFLKTLDQRGFIHQMTDAAALDDACNKKGPITAYIGFDCTAPSLHVGSLVQIMMLRHLQLAGHKPIVLMGGGTSMIGDPSGKDASRQLLTPEAIADNMATIKTVFEKFLLFGDGPTDALMVNNLDWLAALEYIPFLRDIGPHFTINRMLSFDSVKLRLEREQPLTFIEFNYMILQAYDFLELNRREDCVLQMGGSDQWGNIVNGMELTRRVDSKTVFGLTTPLVTLADGSKMGKTARGAVWLNENALPAYDYWQYWRSIPDADVARFLRLFTELPLDEITRLEKLDGEEINEAKKILATVATRLCRGDQAAKDAADAAHKTFEQGGHADALPTIRLSIADLKAGPLLVDLLFSAGLSASKGEARRLIKQGGARINGEKITSVDQTAAPDDLSDTGTIKLSAGKKRHALVEVRN